MSASAAVAAIAVLSAPASTAEDSQARPAVAAVQLAPGAISFNPLVDYEAVVVTMTGPGRVALRREFPHGQGISIAVGEGGQRWPDGQYRYELRIVPRADFGMSESFAAREAGGDGRAESAAAPSPRAPLVQSGGFRIQGGSVLVGSGQEPIPPLNPDFVVADDLIVQGSTCIGLDCVDGEVFGFDTLRLKENNTRIKFDDTSVSAGFPANDWQLTANDSADGGLNKFSIDDVTGAKTPFTVEAGAPTNSLYVDSSGRLGLRTATPVLDIHTNTSNTPALRLEQNNSGGFTAQTWDVAGNEANFFVRDVTGGSRLSFRIRPGAPTSSIDIAGNGNVGVGIASPAASLHVNRTDGTAQVLIQETSGVAATRRLLDLQNNGGVRMRLSDNSTATTWAYQNIGTQFLIDANGGGNEFALTTAGNLTISGTLTQNSDRDAKTDIEPVDPDTVLARVARVPINAWTYKADRPGVRHLGPMAQDFAATFGLGADDRHLAPADVAGVALAAIQALDQRLQQRDAELAKLRARNDELAARLKALEAALPAKEPPAPFE
jgi:hypothetical protein